MHLADPYASSAPLSKSPTISNCEIYCKAEHYEVDHQAEHCDMYIDQQDWLLLDVVNMPSCQNYLKIQPIWIT